MHKKPPLYNHDENSGTMVSSSLSSIYTKCSCRIVLDDKDTNNGYRWMISLKKYLNAKVSVVRMSLCKIKVAYQEIEIGMIVADLS